MNEIIIIGSGLAGLSAAIRCAEKGKNAVIISAQPSYCAQSVMAAGGINAVFENNQENDTVTEHEQDTLKAGCFLADNEAVHNLTENAPHTIEFLERCGVIFSRDENGAIAQRYFGGQKKKRTCYSNSNIGKQLIAGLEQRTRYFESKGLIRILDNHLFIKLITCNRGVQGAIIMARDTLEFQVLEGPVIVASGGMGGLFGNTTGSVHSDGIVTAAMYEAGVKMANLEMIQYHPTTIKTSVKNMLVSESARGEGGRLFSYKNGKRWYFCEDWFGINGNLMPRDVVSRAIYKVINGNEADKSDTVWLDITMLGEKIMNERLSEVCEVCIDYLGIDPRKQPIPVVPAVHYFMGGIFVDADHRTSIKNLYAAGECCAQYHGANRLGGNSTLGAIYGGQCAAVSACEDGPVSFEGDINQIIRSCKESILKASCNKSNPEVTRAKLQKAVRESMGIIREENKLHDGMEKVLLTKQEWKNKNIGASEISTDNILQYQNLLLCDLAEAMIKSACQRRESRGAHYRSDYPETDDRYLRPTIVQKGDSYGI